MNESKTPAAPAFRYSCDCGGYTFWINAQGVVICTVCGARKPIDEIVRVTSR